MEPSATDEPRSRKPARASLSATTTKTALAQIDIHWSADATRALSEFDAEKRALNLVVRQSIKRALQAAEPLYSALLSELKELESLPQWQLNLLWVSDAAMQDINLDTRGKDKPTDVLSFPIWEGVPFPFPPDQAETMLGDVIISIETAARQAQELKHDLRAEVAFLAVHGALHLLGYDHGTDSQRRKMFALQDEIVAYVREAKGF